ncbi:hypothetical protein [Photobacterium damselae]|uniref:hypothetical protein n=1 Tax=Photobacterium damselae TaxID=38293 RepID=UPI0035A82156
MLKGYRIQFIATISLFFLINSFYIYAPINSSMMAPIISALLSVFLLGEIVFYRKTNYFDKRILFAICVLIFYSLFIVLINQTFDFTYLKNIFSQILQLFFIVLTCSLLLNESKYIAFNIERLIVYVFVIQSVIQILAFIFPWVASIVHLTYTEDKLSRLYDAYGGIRGVALTGSPGWGISIGYALVFLLYTKEYVINNKLSFSAVLIAGLLILGAFFTGRSAFIGVIFGFIYFLLSRDLLVNKIKKIFKFIVIISFLLIVSYFMFPTVVNDFVDKVFPFVFEFYYRLQDGGAASTKSTDILINMWKLNVTDYQLLLGTGWFTDPMTGDYFYGSDVGYLRNLLFGGVIWYFILIYYQFSLLGLGGANNYPKNEILFVRILIVMVFVLELKAMTIGFNKYLFTISILLSISYKIRYEREQ